jgi:hypothetical protein
MNARYPILLLLLIAGPWPSRADDGTAAETALARCLDRPDATQTDGVTLAAPPGLSRNRDVKVARLSGARLFEYRGTSPHEISCGIAIYGPVSPVLKARLVEIIQSHSSQWVAEPRPSYALDGAAPAGITYWGNRLAPGMVGVMLMQRPPSAGAPSLEIDYHGELTR